MLLLGISHTQCHLSKSFECFPFVVTLLRLFPLLPLSGSNNEHTFGKEHWEGGGKNEKEFQAEKNMEEST